MDSLGFYKALNYPIPRQEEIFLYKQKTKDKTTPDQKHSRNIKNPHTEKLINNIKKYNYILRSIPFVEHIYICDGTSFNAATEQSDLDLFFVIKEGHIRRARLRSTLLTRLIGRKRSYTNKAEKCDCIFYITPSHYNLETIKQGAEDIYLAYRITHLVPIVSHNPATIHNIYTQNTRTEKQLPNRPYTQSIFFDLPLYTSRTILGYILEFFQSGRRGKLIESCIKHIRKPLVINKAKKRKEKTGTTIIKENILKFHKDQRPKLNKLIQQAIYNK